jgi:hypothetical protein
MRRRWLKCGEKNVRLKSRKRNKGRRNRKRIS